MKFKHCLLLSVFLSSLLIATLLLVSQSTSPTSTGSVFAVAKHTTHRMVILPARHTPREQVAFHPPL